MMRSFVAGLCLATAAAGIRAETIAVDANECREGAEFIGHAAQSRRNGATKDMFIGRLEEDIVVVSGFAPEQRWFVHGDAEAQFLRDAVIDVFEFPRDPQDHAKRFFVSCLRSAGLDANLADAPKIEPDNDSADRDGPV
jgi:hypothetical protein